MSNYQKESFRSTHVLDVEPQEVENMFGFSFASFYRTIYPCRRTRRFTKVRIFTLSSLATLLTAMACFYKGIKYIVLAKTDVISVFISFKLYWNNDMTRPLLNPLFTHSLKSGSLEVRGANKFRKHNTISRRQTY